MNKPSILTSLFVLVFSLLCFAACEKNEYNYYGQEQPTAGTSTGNSGQGNDSGSSDGDDEGNDDDNDSFDDGTTYGDENDDYSGETIEGVLTVAEALAQNYGANVTVEGYVVGASTTNTIKTTEFEPPFSKSNNIVLADTPYSGEEMDLEALLQVKLTDNSCKTIRPLVNLKDNPDLHNHKIQVAGVMESYNRRLGLIQVWQVQRLD